jgi:hypothetical protein
VERDHVLDMIDARTLEALVERGPAIYEPGPAPLEEMGFELVWAQLASNRAWLLHVYSDGELVETAAHGDQSEVLVAAADALLPPVDV